MLHLCDVYIYFGMVLIVRCNLVMGFYHFLCLLTLVLVLVAPPAKGGRSGGLRSPWDAITGSPVDSLENSDNYTRWVVLVAGSNGYDNYRHQADVCHAYQILKRGGLKDENIVVFMYDDIAYNEFNPRKGIIINHPEGQDVYHGVPKDYTGDNVTAENFYAVILGDKSALKGGSGKVVDSKANDRIFIYYADHGSPGLLGMPTTPSIYAKDFIDVLKKKHASGTYKEMVLYVESCEGGSVFEHLLLKDLNIYAQTAANPEENSYATYCPDTKTPPPPGFDTCLGDKYSVSWMEDSETHDLKQETIKQQYERVKNRTLKFPGSHVMQYGTTRNITSEKLYLYQGFINHSTNHLDPDDQINLNRPLDVVSQRDTDLVFLWERYEKSEDGTSQKAELLEQIKDKMAHRQHVDGSVDFIGLLLFGPARARSILNSVREQGTPLVDDWECLKSMVGVFETHCGPLTRYGLKHMRAFANICNKNVSRQQMENTCAIACSNHDSAIKSGRVS